MIVEKIVVGELSENCHIVIDEKSHCLVVDPGDEGEKIDSFIKDKNLSPKAILLTHAHFDHIMATAFLVEKYNCPVVISENDGDFVNDDQKNMAAYMGYHVEKISPTKLVSDGDVIDIDDFRINVISTPDTLKARLFIK